MNRKRLSVKDSRHSATDAPTSHLWVLFLGDRQGSYREISPPAPVRRGAKDHSETHSVPLNMACPQNRPSHQSKLTREKGNSLSQPTPAPPNITPSDWRPLTVVSWPSVIHEAGSVGKNTRNSKSQKQELKGEKAVELTQEEFGMMGLGTLPK